MKHGDSQDDRLEVAAAYALEALSQREAKGLEEHLADECERCRVDLEGFEAVVSNLGFATAPIKPPGRVLEALMSQNLGQVQQRAVDVDVLPEPPEKGLLSIRFGEGDWQTVLEGVSAKVLSVDQKTGVVMSLVRMAPGTRLPEHRHRGVEQFLVLEGDCTVNGELLGPGDFHRAEAGTTHQITYTSQGTLLLLVAPESYDLTALGMKVLE